ncbi:16S rRNA (cytosine(967)-C(5))-methyltransferase RsmB [Oxalobacteraceae bacterium CAVE-383]|nr:16S rRNA (cytosine(967)-C(5))-methyltransferase RsmB [Oxalobacteraceae bacterium CAVE-383]
MTPNAPKNDPLAFHLRSAAQAVAQVKAGTALPQALARIFLDDSLSPQARGAIQDIAYRTMRHLGLAEGLLALLTAKPVQAPVLHGLLSCALALLAGDNADKDSPAGRYDAFTIVDQAVDAAASDPDMAHAKGMVNAVLRRFLRERDALLPQARKTPAGGWNYPVWWVDRVRDAYPAQWQAILQAGNRQPPLTLRVNQRKTDAAAYLHMLREAGFEASAIGPLAIKLHKAVPVAQIPGFSDGLSSVQDAAAQLAAPLLDVRPGMRVLDACAAPGGKTGHLLEIADIAMTALDHDPKRLRRIAENLERLQLQATLLAGDAGGRQWWDGQRYDRILADLPCTASGIVRRHPDIRWLRRKTDTAQLATLSAGILDNLWQMLEPDGKLLLVTCSLWPQESEQQAVAFNGRHKDAVRLPAPGQLLPTADAQQDHDGLFYALFQKNGTGT